MSLGSLIIAIMWLILIGLLVWAIAAGRRETASAGYRLQARLVDVKPRVVTNAPAATAAGTSTSSADKAPAAVGVAAQAASDKNPVGSHPVA